MNTISKCDMPARCVAAVGVIWVLLFIFFTVYGASGGVRGSDQYWYVDHVASLVEGNGPVSNNVYPVSVYKKPVPLPRPFVHNILPVYAVLPAALLTDPYKGWIITNVLCSLLTALLICLAVKRSTADIDMGVYAGLSYLLLPVTFWNTAQPLSEPVIALGVGIAVYIYVTQKPSCKWFALLTITACLLLLSRKSFILLCPIVPLAFLAHADQRNAENVLIAAAMCVCIGLFIISSKVFLVPNVDRSLTDILMSGTKRYPGNMDPFFVLEKITFSATDFLTKVIHSLKIQITGRGVKDFILFYFPFNVSLLIAVILAVRKRVTEKATMAAAIFTAIFLASIVVFQNQFRYQLMAWPAILVALFSLVHRYDFLRRKRVTRIIGMIALIAVAIVFFLQAVQLKKSGEAEGLVAREIQKTAREVIPLSDSVMVLEGDKYLLTGHALMPRLVLFVRDDYSPDQYTRMIENTNCRWFLCPMGTFKIPELTKNLIQTISLPFPYKEHAIYKL